MSGAQNHGSADWDVLVCQFWMISCIGQVCVFSFFVMESLYWLWGVYSEDGLLPFKFLDVKLNLISKANNEVIPTRNKLLHIDLFITTSMKKSNETYLVMLILLHSIWWLLHSAKLLIHIDLFIATSVKKSNETY